MKIVNQTTSFHFPCYNNHKKSCFSCRPPKYDYNKNIQVDKIKYNLENDYKLLRKVNSIYNSNIDKINITKS